MLRIFIYALYFIYVDQNFHLFCGESNYAHFLFYVFIICIYVTFNPILF
jgi:hypothetical protein